jgi:hypothetical protein
MSCLSPSLCSTVVDQVNPHLTLISNKADEALMEGIKAKRTHVLPLPF